MVKIVLESHVINFEIQKCGQILCTQALLSHAGSHYVVWLLCWLLGYVKNWNIPLNLFLLMGCVIQEMNVYNNNNNNNAVTQDTVSVHKPGFYMKRFTEHISNKVFKREAKEKG